MMSINSENLKRIKKSLAWLASKPDGIVLTHSDNIENLLVVKEGGLVSLHFMDTKLFLIKTKISGVMSSIDIKNPLKLIGKYAYGMMLSLVFKPEPKRLYMLGFGGGSIPMVFHHYFPHLSVYASDISQGVIHLAEACFGMMPDERMKITVEDGRTHLESFPKGYFDIILLDSFSGIGDHPNDLSTQEFYKLCKSRLTIGGVVATNLVDNNPCHQQKVATFCAAFKYSYQYEYEGTCVYLGSDKGDFNQDDFQQKAKLLQAKYKFEFPFAESSEHVTPCQAETFSDTRLKDNHL